MGSETLRTRGLAITTTVHVRSVVNVRKGFAVAIVCEFAQSERQKRSIENPPRSSRIINDDSCMR